MASWLTYLTTAGLILLGLGANMPPLPPGTEKLALVFPPWWSEGEIWRTALAIGDVVEVGASRFVLVLHSRDPDFERRARRAGVWLVLDPRESGVCGRRGGKMIG